LVIFVLNILPCTIRLHFGEYLLNITLSIIQ
jgi:hypothetical protein